MQEGEISLVKRAPVEKRIRAGLSTTERTRSHVAAGSLLVRNGYPWACMRSSRRVASRASSEQISTIDTSTSAPAHA